MEQVQCVCVCFLGLYTNTEPFTLLMKGIFSKYFLRVHVSVKHEAVLEELLHS